ALDAFKKSLAIDPYQPDILVHAGEIHEKMNQYGQCARYWSQAAEMDRWNPMLEWRLAELLRKDLNNPAQSIPHYARHAELNGQHADKARHLIQQLQSDTTD
ncbi:MAG: tetratricopeptide repeat protein, partial [Planctomycetota bacterium]